MRVYSIYEIARIMGIHPNTVMLYESLMSGQIKI